MYLIAWNHHLAFGKNPFIFIGPFEILRICFLLFLLGYVNILSRFNSSAKCFSHYTVGDSPVSEKIASTILSLPMFPELTYQQQKFVVGGIKQFLSDES